MATEILGSHEYAERPTVLGIPVLTRTAGAVLQAVAAPIAAQTGTTTIPFVNTTPVISGGTQIWSGSITPSVVTNTVLVSGSFMFDCGTAARTLTACIFRGAVCIGVASMTVTTVGRAVPVTFNIEDAPGVTSAVVYTVRVGLNANGTWYVNQASTAYWNGLFAGNGVALLEVAG